MAHLESLSDEAVKELSLHIDVAGEAGGEGGPVPQQVDHQALEGEALIVHLLAPRRRPMLFHRGHIDRGEKLHLHGTGACKFDIIVSGFGRFVANLTNDVAVLIVLDISKQLNKVKVFEENPADVIVVDGVQNLSLRQGPNHLS